MIPIYRENAIRLSAPQMLPGYESSYQSSNLPVFGPQSRRAEHDASDGLRMA